MKSGYWADLTTRDFAALDPARTVALLPVGATEQHGPHLPLSTDTDLAAAVADRALSHLPEDGPTVLILPAQPVGRSIEHADFPGTLTLSAETLIALWRDIGAGVAAAGLRRMMFFNGHGGNVSTMDIVARDLRAAHGLSTAHTSWYVLAEAEASLDADELTHGIHGGALETAAMTALRPDAVRRVALADFPSAGRNMAGTNRFVGVGGKPVKLGWTMRDLNPDGAAGNAAAADAETGTRLLDTAARNLAAALAEFAALPLPKR